MTLLTAPDLVGRAAAAAAQPAEIPSTASRAQAFGAQLRVATIERDGKSFFHFHGYASTVEEAYEMYDMWGPYTEIVDAHAFDRTLAASPDVAFLINHRGMTMARTKANTLELGIDEHGLISDAYCNPERTDVVDLAHAINDGDVDQMSFAFRIVRGQWSPDYTEYRILEVDLDRGDVSAVNFGANPFTSISARAKQAEAAIENLPPAYLRAMADRAQERLASLTPTDPPAAASTERTSADYLAMLDAGLI